MNNSEHSIAAENFLKSCYQKWIIGILVLLLLTIIGYIISTSDNELGQGVKALQPTLVVSYAAIILVWYGLIRFWYQNFYVDKNLEKKKNPFRGLFFGSINVISLILLGVGVFIAFVIISDEKFFLAIASFITVIWSVVFLRYFMWSVYFYNINYGLTDNDWERILEQREKNEAPDKDAGVPIENPYKNETFGLPRGTVRGMIAFTLLFGGLALLLASMDMNSEIGANSYYQDHFEFFKTAFLMMIAFYFGDASLKYLRKNGNNDQDTKSDNSLEDVKEADEKTNDEAKSITQKKEALKNTDIDDILG